MSPPTACLVLPMWDRGVKLFGGKSGYKSIMASSYLPSTSSIFGFFANRVLGNLDGTFTGAMTGGGVNDNMLHGSSSQYIVFRSKTKRPLYSPQKATANIKKAAKVGEESVLRQLTPEDERRALASKKFSTVDVDPAPHNPRMGSSLCGVAKFTPDAHCPS